MTPHRRDGESKRDALLDAAQVCFTQFGVLGAGVEEIRREAGASPSSLYHFFPDGLPDITAALLERIFARLFTELAVRVAKKRTARSAVEALVLGQLDWVLAHRAEARVMYQAVGIQFPAAQAKRIVVNKRRSIAPLLACFEPFVRARALPAWPAEILDVVLIGPTHEACRRLLMGAPLDVEFLRRTLPALAWRSVSS